MSKINELLAVLDMSKGEQQRWWETQTGVKYGCENCLSNTAFRLTKEVAWEQLSDAMLKVYIYWCDSTWDKRKAAGETKKHIKYTKFWVYIADAIHRIIAALIAKLAKE